MAISKEIINNKKKQNKPVPMIDIPDNNPDHQSAPTDFHKHDPKIKIHNNFADAVAACELIFLKPGEAHTEFYKATDKTIHCVVAIGAPKPDMPHLYLSDSGNASSIIDQLIAMNTSINIINNKVDWAVEELNNAFDALTEEVNTKISELNNNFNDLSTNINNIVNEITIVVEKTVQDVSNAIQDISTFKYDIQSDIDNINSSINELKVKDIQIDSSILQLSDLINSFLPITDASNQSLFHYDIYTVNLCCYTSGGHVEIFDNCGGINQGGTNTRVAECTPFNEYKTYIAGDNVSFKAVENEGYVFSGWWVDNVKTTSNHTIDATFVDSDINVIGTLNTAGEPAILTHGYTALFKKLHKLDIITNCDVQPGILQQMFYNDIIKIYVDRVQQFDFDKIYYDDGAEIRIEAYPSSEGHHDFVNYLITEDGITKSYTDTVYVKQNAYNSLSVIANFKETWSEVTADASSANYGKININADAAHSQQTPDKSHTFYLSNDVLTITANSNDGRRYRFVRWTTTDNLPSEEQLRNDIGGQPLTNNQIVLTINKLVSEYELVGIFDRI